MQVHKPEKRALFFGEIILVAGIFLFFYVTARLLNLDERIRILETFMLPSLTIAYLWVLSRYNISARNTIFFFLALLWLAMIPAINFYACPTADKEQFSYLMADLPWYGTKTGQIIVTMLLGTLGCVRFYRVCCDAFDASKTRYAATERRKGFYDFSCAANAAAKSDNVVPEISRSFPSSYDIATSLEILRIAGFKNTTEILPYQIAAANSPVCTKTPV